MLGDLLGKDESQFGGCPRVAAGVQHDLVATCGQAVAELFDDPFGATVAAGRHRDPGRSDLGDPHKPIVSDCTAGHVRRHPGVPCDARERAAARIVNGLKRSGPVSLRRLA